MRSKKADLSLSVNAIVVFVLAFSMLGVGLFVTNLIKENVGAGIKDVVNIQDLKNPPSPEDPITISREVTLKKGKDYKIEVGFYNKYTEEATDAKIGISNCISPDGEKVDFPGGGLLEDPLLVVSPTASVSASEAKGFKIRIEDRNKLLGTGSYVCTMVAFNEAGSGEGGGGLDYPYEEKQFFLNIVS